MATDDFMKAKKLIAKYKAHLASQRICENFGQPLVRDLEDEFSMYCYGQNQVWPLIQEFDYWCMNYTGGNK